MMANLLARHTAMPVITVENEMEIEPGHVYLIPPGKNMTVSGSQLRLSPKNPRVLSLPLFPDMRDADVARVLDALRGIVG